jgi:N6-adenosine-specific RNA methylase IME4
MWVTFPVLPYVFDVIKAWGFTYKSVAFVWVKRNPKSPGWFVGLGHWTRANAEICIMGVLKVDEKIST